MPGDIPKNDPAEFTLATAVLLLLHMPPVVVLLSVADVPWHIVVVPPISAGRAFIVTIIWAAHPVIDTNVMDEVPAIRPLTMPAEPIVATVVLLLLHVPLPSASVVVLPAHAVGMPLIAGGNAFIVTTAMVIQPEPDE